jgi:uncharacterized membrane protein (DUF373 family)
MAGMRQWGEDAIEKVENVIYVAVAVVLVAVAAVVLASTTVEFAQLAEVGTIAMAAEVLDLLLLVFIVVELLFAVRTTLAERELVAEPFLIVGIIASIKEIVVLSVKAPDYVGTDKIEDTVWLMGVLTVTIGVLAASTLLVRRKEREPSEGDGAGPDAAHDKQADEPAEAS